MKQIFNEEIQNLKGYMLNLPWEDKRFYQIFLSQTYYFVQHSTRLLALASAHCPLEDSSLHKRFSMHIAEEKGHDLLALNDIKKIDTLGQLYSELPETKNLYETQYYKIEKKHSAVLFGYILALEGIASLICPLFFNKIKESHGENASKFLKLHIEEDPDHVEKAFNEIENLSAYLVAEATDNLKQSFFNYRSMLAASLKESSLYVNKESLQNLDAHIN